MTEKFLYFLYCILFYFNKIVIYLFKKNFLIYFKDFIEKDSYQKKKILNQNLVFFSPNVLTSWRVNTYLSKEPETIEWINSFSKKEKIIFWDIGANIGLYSIYNSLQNKNSETIAFEPSTSNLRVLSRNISINNLSSKIKIFPLPLSDEDNAFSKMKEENFLEGGAMNVFKENFNFEGNKFNSEMNYTTFGTSINFLIENKILDIPDYIKIDVDGAEHLILEGGNRFLDNKKIKSLSIEVNENFKEQFYKVIDVMKKNNFKILHKKNNSNLIGKNLKLNSTFNYIFER